MVDASEEKKEVSLPAISHLSFFKMIPPKIWKWGKSDSYIHIVIPVRLHLVAQWPWAVYDQKGGKDRLHLSAVELEVEGGTPE